MPRIASLAVLLAASRVDARAPGAADDPPPGRGASAVTFLAGAAAALGVHEGAHLLFDVVFDAEPRLKKVSFAGIPFVAIAHRGDLSPRREFTISAAGFWTQHALSEWLLTGRPRLNRERAPFAKGVLAFNVLASAAYAGAAFARTGPAERDTRGMSVGTGLDERWIGAMVLAPALLDAYRYFRPDATWARWSSRAFKLGVVLLVIKDR